jgi:hypothetical protein
MAGGTRRVNAQTEIIQKNVVTDLPAHWSLRLQVRVYFLDYMDPDDYLTVYVDDAIFWQMKYKDLNYDNSN